MPSQQAIPPCILNPCVDPSNPLTSFSSEQPDAKVFSGVSWGPAEPPPLNYPFSNIGCMAIAQSANSQEEADLLATAQATACAISQYTTPDGQPVPSFTSTSQGATGTCPDGSQFTLGVPAGLFVALSQQEADAQALQYAQKLAGENLVCLDGSTLTGYSGGFYNTVLTATGSTVSKTGTNVWEISAGSLPPGMTLLGDSPYSGQAVISGQSAGVGTYYFSVRITTPGGNYMEKAFQLSLASVLNAAAISGGNVGTAVNLQLIAVGFVSPAFSLAPGSTLPAGVSLTPYGLLSGTLTPIGNYSGIILVTSAEIQCSFAYTMNVAAINYGGIQPIVTGLNEVDWGTLPAGKYVVAFVSGAWFNNIGNAWWVNINGTGYNIVYDDTPGHPTTLLFPAYPTGVIGFLTFAQAQAANAGITQTIVHAGGVLGLRFNGQGFGNVDSVNNPIFSLTRIA